MNDILRVQQIATLADKSRLQINRERHDQVEA